MRISDWSSDVCSSDLQADAEVALQEALAQPGVHQRGFPARIGADEQRRVGLLDAGDGGVEEIAGAAGRVDQGAVLAAVEVGRAETGHRSEERRGGKEWVRTGRSRWGPDH